jgi:hypothetical protein
MKEVSRQDVDKMRVITAIYAEPKGGLEGGPADFLPEFFFFADSDPTKLHCRLFSAHQNGRS